MELGQLKYFHAVVRQGGFTRASRVLRVQQPAISRMVRALEESLGVTLLERDKRRVRLTPVGEQIFQQCETIFGVAENIRALAESERAECAGPLRVGASDVIAVYLFPEVLAPFLRSHPAVRPSIITGTSGSIYAEVEARNVEFGLAFTPPESPLLVARDLAPIPFVFAISARARNDSRVRASFIGSREVDYPKARSFPAMEMLRRQGLKPEMVFSSNNLKLHKELVLKGCGVALLPKFALTPDLRKGTVVALHAEKRFTWPLKLITRRGKVLSHTAATFLEAFERRLKAHLD